MARKFLFTSESVSEGHPDKLCDAVSDAVLDACLKVDPAAKVACETCSKTGFVMIFGEITVNGVIDYEAVIREAVKKIGYDDQEKGLDYRSMEVKVAIEQQSPEIANGVHVQKSKEEVGAGDQGHVFGFACNETDQYMPLTHALASSLAQKLAQVRKEGILPWSLPDGKTQVTVEYEIDEHGLIKPLRVHTVLISAQHTPGTTADQISKDLKKHVIETVIPKHLLDEKTIFVLNPSGSFTVGGPHGDAGLTGRKIIVDTYGGWGSHGGGAFSGKDSTKVDRSGAYMARHVAKSLVANGFCDRALVQVSYAIGVPEPLSLFVDTYGSVKKGFTDSDLEAIVSRNFDFRPGCIIDYLQLTKPGFAETAAYGHFGRPGFTWENVKDLSHEMTKKKN